MKRTYLVREPRGGHKKNARPNLGGDTGVWGSQVDFSLFLNSFFTYVGIGQTDG